MPENDYFNRPFAAWAWSDALGSALNWVVRDSEGKDLCTFVPTTAQTDHEISTLVEKTVAGLNNRPPQLISVPSVFGHGNGMIVVAPANAAVDAVKTLINEVREFVDEQIEHNLGPVVGYGDFHEVEGSAFKYFQDRLAEIGCFVYSEGLIETTEKTYAKSPKNK